MLRDLLRDRSEEMPVDPDAANLTALRVWHCGYVSLRAVKRYCNLRLLVVATYPDADLEAVGSLQSLEYLHLLHLPGVTDLTPLARLTRLRTVRLATLPSWDSSGKVTEVDSLAPLASIPELRHLELFGIRPPDKSLRDLENASGLVSVRVSKYPKGEVDRFYAVTGLNDDHAPPPGVADWD